MNHIRKLRLQARPPMKQTDLARRAGVSVFKLSVWETGAARPGPANREKIARALGLAVATVFPEASQ